MIRVLLADDNAIVLKYLCQLVDWQALGYEIVGMANDGDEVWELYCSLKPDLIMMDVQMPGKDGREAARLIREKDSDVVILFISSFDKFDYARSAIDLGVQEYILKHELDEKTLREKLLKIRSEIQEKSSRLKKSHYHQLMSCFHMPAKEVERHFDGNESERKYLFFVVEQDHVPETVARLWNIRIPEADYEKLIPELQEQFPQMEELVHIDTYRWIGMCNEGTELERMAAQITEFLHKCTDTTFSVILFGEEQSIAGCRLRYEREQYLFDQRYFEGNGVVMDADLCEKMQQRSTDLTAFLQALTEDSADEAETQYAQLYRKILRERDLAALTALIEKTEGVIRGSGAEVSVNFMEEQEEIPVSARQLIRCLQQKIRKYLDYRSDVARFQSREVVRAIQFMEKEYQDSFLSVVQIAEEAGISVTRLNELFRITLDTTAGRYLMKLRMEKAARMLEEGSLNIAQVGERVGYNSNAYFSRAFRKYFGMTPLEYRQRGRKDR